MFSACIFSAIGGAAAPAAPDSLLLPDPLITLAGLVRVAIVGCVTDGASRFLGMWQLPLYRGQAMSARKSSCSAIVSDATGAAAQRLLDVHVITGTVRSWPGYHDKTRGGSECLTAVCKPSAYNRTMRSWLLIVLMMWMPLQLSWAAMGSSCAHDRDATAQHLGHHVHQHQSFEEAAAKKSAGVVSPDLDCGTCHANCSMALQAAPSSGCIQTSSVVLSRPLPWSEFLLIDRPDRPRWTSPV